MDIALQNLKERLSSPRLRAPTTIKTYLETAERFLTWLGDGKEATPSDFRRYFIYRREHGMSERSLRTKFFHLKKLALSNGWDWPFTAEDTPFSEEEPNAPALMPDDIEKLIKARALYLKSERFYLAISTTFGCRREELARIKKRDYDDNSILIRTAKHGQRVRHLIPDVLKPIFEAYRPKQHTPTAFSIMFHRICKKAEVKVEKGYSFHSIRRTLRTLLEWRLAENRLPLSLVADYQGWSKTTKGIAYGGAPMLGVYAHLEVVSSDPFAVDRLIYPVHPFLEFWEKATSKKRARKSPA
jgi:integrase